MELGVELIYLFIYICVCVEGEGGVLTRYQVHRKHTVSQTQRRILFPWGVHLRCLRNTDQGPTKKVT